MSVAALMMFMGSVNAATIGYTSATSKPATANAFSLSKTRSQGQAICISKAKLQTMIGKTISSVSVRLGSTQIENKTAQVFIATSLGGTPVAEGTVAVSRAFNECKLTLEKPYMITGDEEELYIGYTANLTSNSSTILVADNTCDIKGCNYAIENDEWRDTYGTGRGSAYITAEVDGLDDYVDVIGGASDLDGYYKEGGSYDYVVKFKNAGTKAITSFDAIVTIGGKTQKQQMTGVNIEPKAEYSFNLNGISSDAGGAQDLNIEITNINGGEADIDASDNNISGSLFYYPKNMERGILVEQFTGRDCPNCPAGHRAVSSAVQTAQAALKNEKIYVVAHHSGYYPDNFTTSEDATLASLFQASGAPAIAVSRYCDGLRTTSTPYTIDCQNVATPLTLMSEVSETKPYASLNLETTLDKSTRKLDVKLQVNAHTTLPENSLFQIYLLQDGIVASQSGAGDNYVHDHVLRETLTGNDLGVILKAEPGETATYTFSYTVPEKIHSSFYTDDMLTSQGDVYNYTLGQYQGMVSAAETDVEAVLDNLNVVAFISEYDVEDARNNTIYNCIEAKAGESYKQAAFGEATGIETVNEAKNDAKVYVSDGKIMVDGKYDKMSVYNMSGAQVNANTALSKGVYIVKMVEGGKQVAKKVLVK